MLATSTSTAPAAGAGSYGCYTGTSVTSTCAATSPTAGTQQLTHTYSPQQAPQHSEQPQSMSQQQSKHLKHFSSINYSGEIMCCKNLKIAVYYVFLVIPKIFVHVSVSIIKLFFHFIVHELTHGGPIVSSIGNGPHYLHY